MSESFEFKYHMFHLSWQPHNELLSCFSKQENMNNYFRDLLEYCNSHEDVSKTYGYTLISKSKITTQIIDINEYGIDLDLYFHLNMDVYHDFDAVRTFFDKEIDDSIIKDIVYDYNKKFNTISKFEYPLTTDIIYTNGKFYIPLETKDEKVYTKTLLLQDKSNYDNFKTDLERLFSSCVEDTYKI